jgi:hypothetical protein
MAHLSTNKVKVESIMNSSFQRLLIIGLLAGILLLQASCNSLVATSTPIGHNPFPDILLSTATSQDWESRWLKGMPCFAPCWEGITPGKTTANEAVAILEKLSDFSEVKAFNNELSWKRFNFWVGRGYYNEISDQIITHIRPNFQKAFSLGKMIEVYGNPDQIVATIDKNPDGRFYYTTAIIFQKKGFYAGFGGSLKPEISPNLDSKSITFFAPNEAGLANASNENFKLAVAWEGYQSFDYYCRDGLLNSVPCKK